MTTRIAADGSDDADDGREVPFEEVPFDVPPHAGYRVRGGVRRVDVTLVSDAIITVAAHAKLSRALRPIMLLLVLLFRCIIVCIGTHERHRGLGIGGALEARLAWRSDASRERWLRHAVRRPREAQPLSFVDEAFLQ